MRRPGSASSPAPGASRGSTNGTNLRGHRPIRSGGTLSNSSKGIATNSGSQTKGNNAQNLGQYLCYSGGGESLARCQQRTGHWREAQAFLELNEKAKALERGVAKDPRKKVPTTEELIRIVEHEYKSTSKGSLAEKFQRRTGELHAAQYRQARKVAQLVREWASGGHGFVPEKKPDGIL